MTNPPDDLADLFSAATLRAPEDSIGFLLWRLAHRHQREIDRTLADLDLTHLQFVTLVTTAWLSRQASPLAQTELVAFSQIHPMQVSTILKTLEKKDFIVRSRRTADPRTKAVELTREGIAALHRALPRVKAVQERFFGDADSANLHEILRRNVARLAED